VHVRFMLGGVLSISVNMGLVGRVLMIKGRLRENGDRREVLERRRRPAMRRDCPLIGLQGLLQV
jgi:hypothetical protein